MDWLKKNYDRFALLLLAVALLASSVWIIWSIHGFSDRFAVISKEPEHGKKVSSHDTESLERAQASLKQSAAWAAHIANLFVSTTYVVKEDGGQRWLVNPFDPKSTPLHPPVPNKWFLDHGLRDHILDPDVLDQDPSKCGFSNLEKFQGNCEPLDPASHPSYLTKLRLKQYIKVPFRLAFEAYDDDGSFQINTPDVKVDGRQQPSQFVKLGDTIAGTKFKVVNFDKKTVTDPNTGGEKDISKLTVEHVDNGMKVELPVRMVTDIPDHYARFSFLWDKTDFSVKKGQIFFLKPDPDTKYKLIDITPTEAVIVNIKTETDQIKVPHLE